jgi:hypothetical protein
MKNEKGKPMFAARDTKRIIVDDEHMTHKDLFGDIFPMACVFILIAGFLVYVGIRVIQMLFFQ